MFLALKEGNHRKQWISQKMTRDVGQNDSPGWLPLREPEIKVELGLMPPRRSMRSPILPRPNSWGDSKSPG